MKNSEDVLEKFSQYEISLSYEQIQDIRSGKVVKVLNEHLQYSKKLLIRNIFSILSGFILLVIGFSLVFFSNYNSLIPAIVAALGASLFSLGISQLKRSNSYQEDIHSLKEHFNNIM